MAVIDTTAVNIGLPTISNAFDADLPTIQWVVLIYLLTVSALLLPLGRAADLFGRKRLYVGGFAIFVLGSVLAGSAQSVPWLIAARVVQAVGAASVQGNGMAIAATAFPLEERGKALGLMATTVAAAAVSGPNVGGILIDALSWRALFFMSTVVGPIGAFMSYRILREELLTVPRAGRGVLDWRGMISSSLALVFTLLVFSRGYLQGWTSPFILVSGLVAFGAWVAFFRAELRAEEPMIDLRLFKRRLFSLGSAAASLAFTSTSGMLFMMPFYIQGILGFEPRQAGLIMTPGAFMLAVTGPLAGRLSDRIGTRVLATAGMLLAAGGYLSLSQVDRDSSLAHVISALMMTMAGMGLFASPNTSSILGAVERERYGVASAFITLVRNLGQITGIAIASVLITLAITNVGLEADLGALREKDTTPSPLLIDSFVSGLHRVFFVFTGVALLTAALSLLRGAAGRAGALRR